MDLAPARPLTAAQLIGGQRVALGAVALAAPRAAGRLFALDFEAHSQAAVLTRLFAVRNLLIGVGLLRGGARLPREVWQLNAAVDALDLVGVALETRRASLPRASSAIGAATAASALALSVQAARQAQSARTARTT